MVSSVLPSWLRRCASLVRVSAFTASTLLLGASCTGGLKYSLVTLMPGVMNDPSNRTLRREILNFGSDQFCSELKKRGAPLRMREDQPIMGRFFVTNCDFKEQENGDIYIQFNGFGYAWTQPTSRLGFTANAAVQYNQDFLLDGSTMYAYFRPRSAPAATFKTEMIEKRDQTGLGAVLGSIFGVDQTANKIGAQLMAQELAKGFTVIREANGDSDFGPGIIEKGQRPFHPFSIHGSDKVTLANDRTEIHEQQRDFLGPFEVDSSGRALYVTMNLDGAQAADLFLMRKDAGDAWLNEYSFKPVLGQMWVPALISDVLPARTAFKRTAPLPKGSYYIVIDHSSLAGPVNPPVGPSGGSEVPATISYIVQLGDAP